MYCESLYSQCLQGIKQVVHKIEILIFSIQMADNNKVKVNRIADVLHDLGISQVELANRLGKRPQIINRYCKNTTQPSLSYLREIAIALGVNAQELIAPTPSKIDKEQD